MKILKQLFFFSIITFTISACDTDDFCEISSPTPNLILRFYDKDVNDDLKIVQRLSIIANGKTDSLYTNRSVDSISIPLNTNVTETIYTFKRNESDGNLIGNETATLTIRYTPEEEYLSRSCGFRFIFNNLTFEKTGWIDGLSVTTLETINSQENAHVNIFH
ncbi:hypothetical protein BTO06_09410 [Tenacibaculum sp. SZ-18]|uniref:DUF6452 family protein n=1 Tax=Tenacibaculum sp. SZ-18 TaxID=754423 RepID=UPI000C2D2FBB|nr:DUF6452 family protein [Tenacibaculum sp. SZ-18]AUC15344.1 hypothetical protein BTO06_09410 [Tenacibaculum sp. SZ-18]